MPSPTLDDELIAALRMLTAEPADLTSTDGFLSAEHSLPHSVRARLLDTLDLFGIAHGVLALRQGAEAAALPAVLRRLSQIDRVTGAARGGGRRGAVPADALGARPAAHDGGVRHARRWPSFFPATTPSSP